MSDRLREALEWWESHPEITETTAELHWLNSVPIVAAARRFLALTETGPDYEAAAQVIAKGLGDKLHDGHETEGPCRGCRQDAEAIVDAAVPWLSDYTEEET